MEEAEARWNRLARRRRDVQRARPSLPGGFKTLGRLRMDTGGHGATDGAGRDGGGRPRPRGWRSRGAPRSVRAPDPNETVPRHPSADFFPLSPRASDSSLPPSPSPTQVRHHVRHHVPRRRGHAPPVERVHHRARVLRHEARRAPRHPRAVSLVRVRVRHHLHVRQHVRARGDGEVRRRHPPPPPRASPLTAPRHGGAPRFHRRPDPRRGDERGRHHGVVARHAGVPRRPHRARAGRVFRRRQLSPSQV